MNKNKFLGSLILIGVLIASVLYFGAFFIPWWEFMQVVQILVSIGFLIVLCIGAWIGWMMISTPSPKSMEDFDTEAIDEIGE